MPDSPFRYRGIVEGFYGRPWTHAERLEWIERMAGLGMNTYVYAPKDDPLHREQWRSPYPERALAELRELVDRGDGVGVQVGFAIAPGLSIVYASPSDRAALHAKLAAFVSLGARFLCLALDDVPSELVHDADRERFRSLAEAHVDLAHEVRDALPHGATLWLVPTDYAGTKDSKYLEQLGARLDPAIEVGWTGRSVVSPEIRFEEARARASCLRRRLLVWDNYPVNDGPMRGVLHLGPYRGRAPDLAEHASGVLVNPMQLARASAVAIATAAAYLRAPASYEPEAAWSASIRSAGAGAAGAFETFARGHRFSALAPTDRDAEVEQALDALRDALAKRRFAEARTALALLRERVSARAGAAESLRTHLEDRALAREIDPWIEAHATETRILQEAVDLLGVIADEAPAMQIALAFFRMEGRLTRIPPAAKTSYGPRRHVHPQLESLEDEGARFGDDPVLFLDHCLSEDAVRLAESAALERLGGRTLARPPR